MIADAIGHVESGQSLDRAQMTEVVDGIMRGDCPDEQIEALLVGIYQKEIGRAHV